MDWKLGFSRKQFTIITSALFTTLIIGAIIGYFLKNSTETEHANTKQLTLTLPKTSLKTNNPNSETQTFIVASGETLTSIFHRANLPESLVIQLLSLPLVRENLIHIQPGNIITITTDAKHKLQNLTYTISEEKTLLLNKTNKGFKASLSDKPRTVVLQFKSGVIHHSLAEAAYHAGLTPTLFTQLKAMFAGKINFSRDIQPGDQFKILYQEYYIDDKKDHAGNIVAAEMDTKHHQYRVIRFAEPQHKHAGYYTPTGHAISSLFLKVPIIYKRISSHFNRHRLDPILHRIHPHLGVDLAAPRGTPIKAIGNGHVLLASWVRGYGNAIIIKYNKTYRTLYGHLEKFAKGLHAKQYVKKGQIVGYVGSTGWSTGPHLHFEIYKNGNPVDPLKLHFPHSPPLPKKYHHAFSIKAQHLLSEMQLFEQTSNAMKAADKVKT